MNVTRGRIFITKNVIGNILHPLCARQKSWQLILFWINYILIIARGGDTREWCGDTPVWNSNFFTQIFACAIICSDYFGFSAILNRDARPYREFQYSNAGKGLPRFFFLAFRETAARAKQRVMKILTPPIIYTISRPVSFECNAKYILSFWKCLLHNAFENKVAHWTS